MLKLAHRWRSGYLPDWHACGRLGHLGALLAPCYPWRMLLGILVQLLQNSDRFWDLLPVLVDAAWLSVVSLLIGLTIHESSHALMAHALGDDTAKNMGRISLNPLRHLDPFGAAMMLIVGFGWGRPVQIDIQKLRFGPLRGAALVGLAGPVSNIVLAMLFVLPVRLDLVKWHSPLVPPYQIPFLQTDAAWVAADIVGRLVATNILLATVNLFPVAPLDGSRLLGFFLPNRALPFLMRYEVVGLTIVAPIFLVLVLLDIYTGSSRILGTLAPAANFMSSIIVGRPLVDASFLSG